MKIYLAGPLFTTAERDFNSRLAHFLRSHGIGVWLPQENEPRVLTAKNIFDTDVEGIRSTDAVVAIMDGPDPDSGTCWEVGYAYALGRYILEVRTDFRGSGEGNLCPWNLMLTESANHKIIVKSFETDMIDLSYEIAHHLQNVTLTVGPRI